jgi:hypothetical protein
VVLPLHIHADTTCNTVANMQLYIDGAEPGTPARVLNYHLTSATPDPHRVVVQGLDSGGAIKAKIPSV